MSGYKVLKKTLERGQMDEKAIVACKILEERIAELKGLEGFEGLSFSSDIEKIFKPELAIA